MTDSSYSEPSEPVVVLNKRLKDYYGLLEGYPKFRVVWSTNEYERRLIRETPEGFILLTPVIKTLPKYNYARDRYILEKITAVPDEFIDDVGSRLSYEPIWVFEDSYGNSLPPKWEAIVVIFKSVEEMSDPNRKPYKQDEKEGNTIEALEEKAKVLQEQLYGNETPVTDALALGSGVGYGTYRRDDSRFNNNPLRKSE
jgi:hypothetical protein